MGELYRICLYGICSSLTSTSLFRVALSTSPHPWCFGARYFWTTSTRSYLQRPEPLVYNSCILEYLLPCLATFPSTLPPDTEAQTTNGMIWINVYISIFYYSNHFRNAQIIYSEYLLVYFPPSKLFSFDLKPSFVVQVPAHLIRPNRATEQLWRDLKISQDSKTKPSEIGLLSSRVSYTPLSPMS